MIMVASLASCERPFLEPWPPDAARTEQDVWDTYDYCKGMIDVLYADQIMAPYVNDITGNGMLASATDEAEHSVSTAGVQNFTNGVWNPTNIPTVLLYLELTLFASDIPMVTSSEYVYLDKVIAYIDCIKLFIVNLLFLIYSFTLSYTSLDISNFSLLPS